MTDTNTGETATQPNMGAYLLGHLRDYGLLFALIAIML